MHIPSTRKRKNDPITYALTTPQSNVDIHLTHTTSASMSITLHCTNIDKRPRLYAIFARMTNLSSSSKKLMIISIKHYLPSVNLHIDNPKDSKNRIRMLVDTRATINTETLEYHLWVMSQCPEMMEKYLQCGKCIA